MDAIDFLNKKLTIDELDKFLSELMNYSAIDSEYPFSLEPVDIFDDEGEPVHYYNLIGNEDIKIVRNALMFKEKIDEHRGEWRGRSDVRNSIKQALGIN